MLSKKKKMELLLLKNGTFAAQNGTIAAQKKKELLMPKMEPVRPKKWNDCCPK